MTDPMTLDELKARRDAANGLLRQTLRATEGPFNDRLDALLKLEGDVRVLEAAEALEVRNADLDAIVPEDDEVAHHESRGWSEAIAFLRARLTANESTPEETGR